MPIKIKYAYLKDQTWLYRRHFPKDVALVLGTPALKRSLKTGDPKIAAGRAAELSLEIERQIESVRSGVAVALDEGTAWEKDGRRTLDALRATLGADVIEARPGAFRQPNHSVTIPTVGELSRRYLRKRAGELRPGGYKSVRYSVGLFSSKFGDRPITAATREDGRWFTSALPGLSTVSGKSWRTRGLGLDALLAFSAGRPDKLAVRTQKRIWSQVNHFLDWTVYEGHRETNPFRTVLLDRKVRPAPYAVLTDDEVTLLLAESDPSLREVMLFCLLSGLRAGEAAGLLRDDLADRGNLGTFVQVRPNRLRQLKTEAAERVVPLHPALRDRLASLPAEGPLFPGLSVNMVTKAFAKVRAAAGVDRPGVVFHSTRKWFITQCERTGVPEHFTASLVGHKSARSENKLTYGIYSAGISDEQKRGIVDQIRLPA
jgi:integrase